MTKRKLKLRKRSKVAVFALTAMLTVGLTTGQLENPNTQYSFLCAESSEQLPYAVCEVKTGTIKTTFENFEKQRIEKECAEQESKRLAELQLSSRSGSSHFRLSESVRRTVECLGEGEARGESYKGKQLVALCILNGCIESDMQPSQVRRQYQYSGWNENVSEETKAAVRAVFDNGEKVVTEPILWFYAPKWCEGKFHETQTHVITEGGHKFFMRNPK